MSTIIAQEYDQILSRTFRFFRRCSRIIRMETTFTVLKRWSLFDFFDEQASGLFVNELFFAEEFITSSETCTTDHLFVYPVSIAILQKNTFQTNIALGTQCTASQHACSLSF